MKALPLDDKSSLYKNDVQKLRPAVGMSWFDAIEFCNKLSELCGYECVYTMENIVRKNNNSEYKDVERMMKETLGSNVKISNNKITIKFNSVQDLNRILEIMNLSLKD